MLFRSDGFGNQWIDLTSGIMTANVGHSHPKIMEAIHNAVDDKLLFSYVFPAETRKKLLEKIVSLSPIPDSKVILYSSGTEATECTMMLMRFHGKSIFPKKVGILSFRDSYHGLAFRGGDLSVANCASCHGWHDILPSSDPRSSIHSKNLPQTCGKCHPASKTGLIVGKIHVLEKAEEHFLLGFFRSFYLVLIPLVIGMMMIHNFADYFRKLITSTSLTNSLTQKEYQILRMNINERIQHGILLSTFIVLAYSGFALKYPDTWRAIPFNLLGGESIRKVVHRWSAFAFILNGVYHLCYMSFTRRGRFILTHNLFPKIEDIFDPFRLFVYNLSFKEKPPKIKYPSYIERSEYWALIWGSIIMIVTGGLLFFNDYTLRYFSLWVANLATMIHYYEAILASFAILIWHFYWVIFDPHVYPMNWSWITGKITKVPKVKGIENFNIKK